MSQGTDNLPAMDRGYGYGRILNLSFDEAVRRAKEALQAEGFGVLCEIDIKQKFKEKLGVEMENYLILGACNPSLAHGALQMEMDIGLLLPCNVVLYVKDDRTHAIAVDAAKLLSVVGNPSLAGAARQVNEKLRRAINNL